MNLLFVFGENEGNFLNLLLWGFMIFDLGFNNLPFSHCFSGKTKNKIRFHF